MGKKDKRIERNRKATIQREAENRAILQMGSKSSDWFDKKIAPSKNTVIFKGMTLEIADRYSRTYHHDLQFPLEDLYAEVKTDLGTLKIHWKPFDMPASRKAVRDYLNNSGLKTKSPLKPEHILSTVYASVDGIYYIGNVIRADISPEITASSIIATVTESYSKMVTECNSTPKEIAKIARRNKIDDIFSMIEPITYTIQTFVSLFLNDDPIPDLGLDLSKSEKAETSHSMSRTPKDSAPSNTHTASVYFDAETGKLVVGGGGKNYHMKWWIVSGHKRHMADGRIVNVQPYIKGDKTDPDAIKALDIFISAQKRVKCFKLVPKR